ncbi:MAG: respiratory nitrate reductase subunit gamma [Candidatus Heimdallarchaeota archaeon]|nr:respiratory nitrate reductase subunit gamma [Candidatus Heimdallarchaeota archaeon]
MNVIIEYIMYYILPYITLIVFIGGLTYRIISWIRTPAPNSALEIYPKLDKGPKLETAYALDQTVFPSLFSNKKLAIFSIGLHLSIVALFFGHIRIFGEPQFVWNILGLDDNGVDLFAYIMGGTFGIIFLISLLFLLGRRFFGIVKKISVPIDYILLIFLILIAVSGDYMRFFDHINVVEIQTYFSSLVVFNPTLTPALNQWSFILHNLLVQAFLIYVPFSKVVHVIGSFITNRRVKRGDKK